MKIEKIETVEMAYTSDAMDHSMYSRAIKRVLDVVLVLVALPVALPLIIILALLVKRDGGPAFFGQLRIGRNGEEFICWKLRSMRRDAESYLPIYLAANPDAKAEWDQYQKLRKDPRITPVGRFIRKTCVDELPQIWCVLTGSMSIVGPRPFLPEQKSLYPGKLYYELRPGITGNWQISDRSDTLFTSRAEFDDQYAKSISLWTDIKILFQTVRVIFRAESL